MVAHNKARLACWCAVVALVAAALGVLAVACSQDGREGSTGAPKVYRLRLSHHIPPTAPPALAVQEWADKVEQATGGQVEFTIYAAESLARGGEALECTESGACDVAMINLAYVGEQWRLNSVLALGSVAVPSGRGTEIWSKLQERFPQMAAEMSSVKVLAKSLATNTSIHVEGKEIRVPDDIKGMKIAAMGDSVSVLEAAGATPVSVSSGDWATSAEKGVIVGCMAPIYVVTDRGLETTFNTHVDLGLGQGGSSVVMNWEVWHSLPVDVQAAIDGLTPWLSEALQVAAVKVEAEGWQKCAGQTVVKPTAEESALWMACFEPSAQQWIRENASRGPAQEIYDYFRQLTAE